MPAMGTGLSRVDGPAKLLGTARYAGDHYPDRVVHAWPVGAAVARGTVIAVHCADVLADPRVLAVLHPFSVPRLGRADDPDLMLFQSPQVRYRGQFVAAVVATDLDVAREAAARLRIDYSTNAHDCRAMDEPSPHHRPETAGAGHETDAQWGDFDGEWERAAVRLDRLYTTPAYYNNPMEPHASTAWWDGDGDLVVHDSSQGTGPVRDTLGGLFGLAPERIRVITEHVGGAFGAKGTPRPNVVLAALAARVTGRPAKVTLTREHQFTAVGHRPPTSQRVRLGADRDGTLRAVGHDSVSRTSPSRQFVERAAVAARSLYDAPSGRTTHRLVHRDVPAPWWMRAPGFATGMFALESAIDELANECGIDPITWRIRHEPVTHPASGQDHGYRDLVTCLREGARRFGWERRGTTGSGAGNWLLGTGVASATYPVHVSAAEASAAVDASGNHRIAINATDLGTGARTALAQIAADALGVPVDRIEVSIGDSALPAAEIAAGSQGTASWGWAVHKACLSLREAERESGPGEHCVRVSTADDIAARGPYPRHSFGAQFVAVRVHRFTGELRVDRMLGVFAAGRAVNPLTARSQLIGGMVMGLSMALLETEVLDPRYGDCVHSDLENYQIATCADVGDCEAVLIEEEDLRANPLGVKGLGEIGMVGVAAAVANAVYHATGVRLRQLPIRLDSVISSMETQGLSRP